MRATIPLLSLRTARTAMILAIGAFTLSLAVGLQAQTPQLSLADLLIGLRSKKVTLEERNRILAEAVRQRGITFSLTGEIEKELASTGAGKDLIGAIREKDAAEKAEKKAADAAEKKPADTAKANPAPVATPTPPDFAFYKSRADVSALKGDFTGALADYSKSLELKPDNAVVLLSRGQTHFNLKSYDLSLVDFSKAAELNPNDSMTFMNRAMSYEKLGDTDKAIADYQKAVDLDAANETAKAALKRMQDEKAKLAVKPEPVAAPPAKQPEPLKRPEFINLGPVGKQNITRLVTPSYPPIASRSKVEGMVVVEITIDEDGEVIEAKAVSGHQMLRSAAEDAAARSKFKPAMFDKLPIKAKATLTYNFSLNAN